MDYLNDNNNCGGCGNVCESGETCCNGDCVAISTFQTDGNNCGSYGNECPWTHPHCCGGRCVDLDWDDDNCGSCGNECPWTNRHCTDSYCYNIFEVGLYAFS
jgi:hypothetical protein